jgi:hypothetical protein
MVSAGANCGSNLSQNEVYEFEAYCSSTNYQYTENLIDFGSTESGLLSTQLLVIAQVELIVVPVY